MMPGKRGRSSALPGRYEVVDAPIGGYRSHSERYQKRVRDRFTTRGAGQIVLGLIKPDTQSLSVNFVDQSLNVSALAKRVKSAPPSSGGRVAAP